MARTNFVIWFNHRSGSTHLVSLLDSHPEIACFPEIFFLGEGGVQDDLFTLSEVQDEWSFLSNFFSYEWGPAGANLPGRGKDESDPLAVGFKLKYSQAATYPRVLDYMSQHRGDIKVVHLVRKNLLASLASGKLIPELIKRFNTPSVRVQDSLSAFSRSVRLEPRTLVTELTRLEAHIENNRRRIESFHCLDVTYESLVSNESDVLSSVLDFLDVPSRPNLKSSYQKILPVDLTQAIINFEEVRSVLCGTKFEQYLSSTDHGDPC